MWKTIIAELEYNKAMYILMTCILVSILVAGVLKNKFGIDPGERKVFDLIVLISFLLIMFTRKRPQRDRMYRVLPIPENHTALGEMITAPMFYCSMSIVSMIIVYVAAGTIAFELFIRTIIDLSLLLLVVSIDLINKDIFAFPNKKLMKVRVQFFVFPATVVWGILMIVLTDLFYFEFYDIAREFLSSGINPIILLMVSITVVYARISIYKRREQYTRSFFISFMK